MSAAEPPENATDGPKQYGGIIFEWDTQKAAANLRKHGVSFDEAMTTFGDENQLVVADREHSFGEVRMLILGRSEENRILAVFFTERGTALRLISARVAEPWERREYEFSYEQE